jgi:hypothetical protein
MKFGDKAHCQWLRKHQPRVEEGMMYEGDDRVKQVDWIRELAGDIAAYSGVETVDQVEEAISMWLNPEDAWKLDLPRWFDDHDRKLLVRWVKEGLQ